jgi:hypothetical protein
VRAVEILRRRIEAVRYEVDVRLFRGVLDAVGGLLRGRQATLTAVGRSLERRTCAKYRIKTVDRLLGNLRLWAARLAFFRELNRPVVWGREVIVLVDWFQVDARHYALCAAIPTSGRAQPLYVEAHPNAKVSNRRVHRLFLDRLAKVLPSTAIPTIVTDAGFQATWMDDVARRKWNYIARLRHKTAVRRSNESWRSNKSLHPLAGKQPLDLGSWLVRRDRPVTRRLVLSAKPRRKGRVHLGRRGKPSRRTAIKKHKKAATEPWLLATSLEVPAEQVVAAYALRMQIEETFRDVKNPRFGWSLRHMRSSSPKRLDVLLMIVALAFAIVIAIGREGERGKLHLQMQANTSRRRCLSLFVLGSLLLQLEPEWVFHKIATRHQPLRR